MTGVLIRRGNQDTDIYTGRPSEGTREDDHLQAKEKGLRRNQPCKHLDIRLLVSEVVKIEI